MEFSGTVGGHAVQITRQDVYAAMRGRQPRRVGQQRWEVEVRGPGRPPAFGSWYPAKQALLAVLEHVLPPGTKVEPERIPSTEANRVFTALGFALRKSDKPPERLTRGDAKGAAAQRDSEPDHPNVTTKERPR